MSEEFGSIRYDMVPPAFKKVRLFKEESGGPSESKWERESPVRVLQLFTCRTGREKSEHVLCRLLSLFLLREGTAIISKHVPEGLSWVEECNFPSINTIHRISEYTR